MSEQAKRQTELDVLRLLATLAVIMIHAGGISASCGIAPLVWCVPVFFLISGRFFLDPARNVTATTLFRKSIPHIAIAVLFWSAVFTVYYILSGSYSGLNQFGIITEFLCGPYHLWFLYTLAGLYLLTPILRRIAADDKILVGTLLLFFGVNILTEYLVYLPKVGNVAETLLSQLGLQGLTGYWGYYLLGVFLWKKKDAIRGRTELLIYLVGLLLFAATIVAECFISQQLRETDFVKQYLKPNVIIFSSALYLFFIKRVSQWKFSEKARRVFQRLTEYGFGVYCIHALLNELIPTPQIPSLPVATLFLRVLVLYLTSLALTWLIRKIPVVGKKIT